MQLLQTLLVLATLVILAVVDAFVLLEERHNHRCNPTAKTTPVLLSLPNEINDSDANDHESSLTLRKSSMTSRSTQHFSRRHAMSSAFAGWLSTMFFPCLDDNNAWADDASSSTVYRPAKRPTAYFVDSTIPPTLIPLKTARQQTQILINLGKGSGTQKESLTDDRINLNNMLNKAVFGTANQISNMLTATITGPTFVCLGLPTTPSTTSTISSGSSSISSAEEDLDLAFQLSDIILRARRGISNTAIGLAICPWSLQPALDQYIESSNNGKEDDLVNALLQVGIPKSTINMYLPLFRYAHQEHVKLIALAPEQEDVATARRNGLQNVNPERRLAYVPDSQGFIAMSQDPQFRLYADRSLLKDYTNSADNRDDSAAKFFAERILVHEAAATAVAQFAVSSSSDASSASPSPLVIVLAPTSDLRYLCGINKRIPRVVQYLDPTHVPVPTSSVTTILLNPTAASTLSKTRYLRLEIGTGPDTLDYQAKVADYLWFSKVPKVNMISRLMDN